MSTLKTITRNDAFTVREILTWFAKQGEEVQISIMRGKHREFVRLQQAHPKLGKPLLDLAALVLAVAESGWNDEQAYRSSKSLGDAAVKGIKQRRQSRAANYLAHREQVRNWLARNWGKVMDMRRAGLSWRRVATMVADEHGISISHTAIHAYWRRWNERH